MFLAHDEIINMLIEKYGLKSYLEIGLDNGDNFIKIKCDNKESVDPYFETENHTNGDKVEFENGDLPEYIRNILTYRMTSDDFFASTDKKYDLIFIDGLHTEEQAGRDIINGLKHLNPGGFIVAHDCLPPREECQIVPRICGEWNGDVWKAISMLRLNGIQYDTVDSDYGCAVIQYTPNYNELQYLQPSDCTYNVVFSNYLLKKYIMHIISTEDFIQKYM